MKIAMIGHKAVPGVQGGVERHVEELGSRLAAAGMKVTLYNRCGYGMPGLRSYRGMGLRGVFTVKSKNLEAPIYSFLAALRATFGGADIVHFHALGPALMCFIPRQLGKKVVTTVHGLDWQRAKWGRLGRVYLKLGERAAVRFSHKIICVSRKLKEYIDETYPRCASKAVWLTNGVNPAVRRPPGIISRRFGLDGGDYILFLARLVPEKGCHYLIEAFSRLAKEERRGVKLAVAGGSSHTDEYCSGLMEAAPRDVIFTGEVGGQTREELLSNARLFVLPSEIEGLPISLLEAMSYGLCPLVSDIAENVEALTEGAEMRGFTFRSRDAGSLREALARLLSSDFDAIEQTGRAAESLARRRHDWDWIAGQTAMIYLDLM